jgi:hypothetical protein
LTDIVYLKNGSMIKGTIIEEKINEYLKIQTSDGSIFVYKISEVESIKKNTGSSIVYKDEIRLKNGSVIKGKIISASEETIKIQSSDGNIFEYRWTEVDTYGYYSK